MEMNITEERLNQFENDAKHWANAGVVKWEGLITFPAQRLISIIELARQGLRFRESSREGRLYGPEEIALMQGQLAAAQQSLEAAKRVIEAGWRLSNYSYQDWSTAGGPKDCKHGICIGIHCERCDKELVDHAINAEKEKL